MATTTSLSVKIDSLFERYLYLLDQYTTLRASLASAQSAIQQNIARANFSADRGIRYGQDFYDLRMQAIRLCCVTIAADKSTPNFAIRGGANRRVGEDGHASSSESEREGLRATEEKQEGHGIASGFTGIGRDDALSKEQEETKKEPHAGEDDSSLDLEKLRLEETEDNMQKVAQSERQREERTENTPNDADGQPVAKSESDSESTKDKNTQPRDPIWMFGFFIPPSLRIAQKEAINMVEAIIPQLVSIDTEMKDTEIRIRRARKHRAKAEAEIQKAERLNEEKLTKPITVGGK